MTPCKGIHRISCTRKGGCILTNSNEKNVQPGCIACPDALTQIIDLEDKVIFEYRAPSAIVKKIGARAKKK